MTGEEGTIFLWDRASFASAQPSPFILPTQVFHSHLEPIYGAWFSPLSSHLVCVGERGVILTWNVDTSVP